MPLRTVEAPQEARRPKLFPAAGSAWVTLYLSILLVKPCKDLFKFYLNALVNVPREAFIFPFISFSLYVLGPSLSATPPPLRYVRVRAPQGRGVREASRGKSSQVAMLGAPL